MDDTRVLTEWATRAGMGQPVHGPDTLHGWGDMETSFEVRREGSRYTVVRVDRGSASVRGWFDTQAAADAFLLTCFGTIWRANEGLADVFPREPAPGAALRRAQDGYLGETDDGARALFRARSDAKRFGYIGSKTLSEIEAFLRG